MSASHDRPDHASAQAAGATRPPAPADATRPAAPPLAADAQRLAFGRVAELYDRLRPPWPARAIDALVDGRLEPGALVVEVGAGTGKATVELARRGLRVVAVEPSAEMARLLAANCARWPAVRIERAEFERWEPDVPARAVVCANAWHWLHPTRRWWWSHRALSPGGTLAALWTLPDWDRCALRAPLSEAYRAHAPQLSPDFPMHPDSRPDRLAGDWRAEVAASGLFTSPDVRELRWSERYDAASYSLLLRTHQDHILLDEAIREPLLAAVSDVIARHGGGLQLPLFTRVCLAVRRDLSLDLRLRLRLPTSI